MKTLIYFLVIILCPFLSHSQSVSFEWAKQYAGASQHIVQDVAVDKDGNVFTTGHFQGTVDFDPGPGVYNLTAAVYNVTMFIFLN